MSIQPKRRPVVLCVLDGWGLRTAAPDNAVTLAKTPVIDRLFETCPHGTLDASEGHVGLPAGQMGNSEVGHTNLGAGRVVMQDLPRIDKALADGSLAADPKLGAFIAELKQTGGTCHLLGLLSPGGVHSHQDQIAGLARIVAAAGVPVAVHAFLDGRDTPPESAKGYLAKFQADVADQPGVSIASVSGRFYAMDRDNRWDRVETAYNMMVELNGRHVIDIATALADAAARGETDEFVTPTAIGEYGGMIDDDGLLMANFRADRAREILTALLDPDFDGFEREYRPEFAASLGLVEYSTALNPFMDTLFPPAELTHTLGDVVSAAGLKQLRIAETEKYAHVTFFLNGGVETVFPGEERILVPSPKVRTYDEKPAMSAVEVTDKLVEAIDSKKFDLVVVNYANTDMVGHTGDIAAATAAVEAVDACLGRLEKSVLAQGGALFITADHGNAEQMRDPVTGAAHTAHTLNPVPSILVGAPEGTAKSLRHGVLADVAPTLLALMGLPQPAEMTGKSLLDAGGAADLALAGN